MADSAKSATTIDTSKPDEDTKWPTGIKNDMALIEPYHSRSDASSIDVGACGKRGIPNFPSNAQWVQQGVIVAEGLDCPIGLDIDDDDTIVVADFNNHRIMQYKKGDTKGQVVAGGNGKGKQLDQLNHPCDVLIDKETNSLIICEGRRVVRWSRCDGTKQGEVLIDKISCFGLAMDDHRNLYANNTEKEAVKRYEIDRGDKEGTLVAGGNGGGSRLHEFYTSSHLFIDREQSVYVSDRDNHRVMKWEKGAKQGIVVAGGQYGKSLTGLWCPQGLFVDTLGTVYVAEWQNNRVTCWSQSMTQGTMITNDCHAPRGLSFDRHGNLYVVEFGSGRVKRFSLQK